MTRLLEIGIDPFTFADSLLGVLAQRLVRRLCTNCRRPEPMSDDSLQGLARDYLGGGVSADEGSDTLVARWRREHGDKHGRLHTWRRQGCDQCDGQGYRGRLGLHELLIADERMRAADPPSRPGQRVAGRGAGRRHGDAAPGRHREGAGRPDRPARGDRGDQRLKTAPRREAQRPLPASICARSMLANRQRAQRRKHQNKHGWLGRTAPLVESPRGCCPSDAVIDSVTTRRRL